VTDQKPNTDEVEWSDGETTMLARLEKAGLPIWEYKAQAALYAQGHRGILDLDLDFPSEYLKQPTEHCYVWKIAMGDGTRVHAYATVGGTQFHLTWLEVAGDKSQILPEHFEGPCAEKACAVCQAAKEVVAMCSAGNPEKVSTTDS